MHCKNKQFKNNYKKNNNMKNLNNFEFFYLIIIIKLNL